MISLIYEHQSLLAKTEFVPDSKMSHIGDMASTTLSHKWDNLLNIVWQKNFATFVGTTLNGNSLRNWASRKAP